MGGWLFIVSSSLLLVAFVRPIEVAVVVAAGMVAFGAFGAIDDLANLQSRIGIGLSVRQKFLWHILIAMGLALVAHFWVEPLILKIPGSQAVNLGIWIVPLTGLAIFATTSGVNEIDGLDGLAAGTTICSLLAFAAIFAINERYDFLAVALVLSGALAGFLWFNVNPALLFMGDTGSLALGAALALIAAMSGWLILLPVVGALLVIEILSVIIQVGYFKLTGGKRIFKMSPIHHHFELSGWTEPQIVQRFWIGSGLAGLLGVAVASLGKTVL
jgi:phospho-N-acetylmuramoyl-pentapeptide-transferase